MRILPVSNYQINNNKPSNEQQKISFEAFKITDKRITSKFNEIINGFDSKNCYTLAEIIAEKGKNFSKNQIERLQNKKYSNVYFFEKDRKAVESARNTFKCIKKLADKSIDNTDILAAKIDHWHSLLQIRNTCKKRIAEYKERIGYLDKIK